MKFFLTAAIILAAPVVVLAQTPAPAAPAKVAEKPAAKASASSGTVATVKKKQSPAAVRRSALKTVEEVTPIDDDPNVKLTDADLALAKKVYVGVIPCELGASVTITPSEKRPGFFLVQTKGARFSMHPVEARTGAIRLEDPRRGALWIQLGNKSMLMSQKLGTRLADEVHERFTERLTASFAGGNCVGVKYGGWLLAWLVYLPTISRSTSARRTRWCTWSAVA